MPTNKQLTDEALEIATGLDLSVETYGLNNKQLAELVADLKAKKKDAELDTAADAAELDTAADKPRYIVGPGKAVTTKRGILSDGDEIKASDLYAGDAALSMFVDKGHVVKNT